MIRVSTFFKSEQIGISASSYKKLTGTDCELSGREIICAVSEANSPSGKNVPSGKYEELNRWLAPGKLTDDIYQQISTENISMSTKNYFQIKKVHTQNWFGE